MSLQVEQQIIPSHRTESDRSWQVVVEPDQSRRKESLQGMRKSLYWLTFGLNSDSPYQPDARVAYSEEIHDPEQQQKFTTELGDVLALYQGIFVVIPSEKTERVDKALTIIGTYEDTRYGKAALVVRHTGDIQRLEHTWAR